MLPFSVIELWGTVLSITVPTIHFEAQNWMSLQKDWLIVFTSVEIDTNYCGEGGRGTSEGLLEEMTSQSSG